MFTPDDLQGRLLFAIPKKGRLHEQVLKLLSGADIQFRRSNRVDIALCSNMPIALVFLGASDIAKFVAGGNVDIGITGQDMLIEYDSQVVQLLPLGFGKCDLSVQVPISSGITSPEQLIGKRIVTSFSNVTSRFFKQLEDQKSLEDIKKDLQTPAKFQGTTKTSITHLGGSVEAACGLGLAEGIVDLVESGETMRAAKLMQICVLLSSQAVLICNPKKQDSNPLIETIRRRIKGVIDAQKFVLCNYNVHRDHLAAAKKITPGKRAPTVSPLDDDNWVAVSSMVLKKDLGATMDQLADVGAHDILVFNIENCRD
ncbi:hypothetical protein EDD86DRAFT_187743 [Gorgonomyces haynaldii]|nr:hypothetical protein EDD86DRAFT_187743 [Gorgonomyces haynaldii]